MKLAQLYSLSTGLKLNKPYIYKKFYPIRTDKNYIIFHNSSGNIAKNYPFFQEVIDIIKPFLDENNIDIIQLGGQEDPKLNNLLDYTGATDISQTAHLIEKSILLIGNDSMLVHLAGSLDIPVIGLYGPTSPENHGPYWHTDNSIFIEADRKGFNPSFTFNDATIIRNILPEEVAKNILSVLNIKSKITVKSEYFGDRYNDNILELVPDSLVPDTFFPGAPLNIRNDYLRNPEVVYRQLQIRKCIVITKTPLDVNILKQLKPNIISIVYEIDKNHNPQFIKDLKKSGINYDLFTLLSEEEVNDYKLDYFDLGIIRVEEKTTSSKLSNKELISSNTKFKINKKILSAGKFYLSKAHFALDIPTTDFNSKEGLVIDTPKFWEEIDFTYIFNS